MASKVSKLVIAYSVATARSATAKLTLLDPHCGRVTTLDQALMYGWDASGSTGPRC